MHTHSPAAKNQTNEFEKLLYKIIIQFSLYNYGLDNTLDPHLDEIRHQLKAGFDEQKIQPALKNMSVELAKLGNANTTFEKLQSTLVFEYLKSTIVDLKSLKSIDNVQHRYQNGEFSNTKSFFDALKLVIPKRATQATENHTASSINHKDIFRTRLNSLLSTIDIPPQFNFGVDILKQRTRKPLKDAEYQHIIEDSIKLLLNIKKHTEQEQQGIERFLKEFYQQICEVEQHALSVSESTQSSIQSHQSFTSELTSHVENIKNSSSSAVELSSLQQNINQHLADITRKLDEHTNDEETRQHETQDQLATMQDKLQEMETEAAELKSHLQLAHDKAMHDALTGIPNRLAYNERVELEQARWKRYKQPLCLIVWDIDHFKLINDNHGHKSGDRTLSLIAQLIINNCRDTDFVARYGGEEFVMLLPNTDIDGAPVIAESIRKIISKSGFNANGKAINITISCGISEFSENDTHEVVFERADKALYEAKQQGRNRYMISHPKQDTSTE
jgi:diguanylate cyclase